jgi:hypothetical protein
MYDLIFYLMGIGYVLMGMDGWIYLIFGIGFIIKWKEG